MPINFAAVPFSKMAILTVERVARALNVKIDFVRPVASDDYKVTQTEDVFVYLRFYEPSPVDAHSGSPFADQGAGRHLRIVGRTVRAYIYTRSGVDTYGGDEIALGGREPGQNVETPPTIPGQWVAEELVLNALDNWQIEEDGAPLSIGPVHWLSSGGGPAVRKPENEEGLVRSHLDFQIVYSLAITRVEPAPKNDSLPVLVK